MTIQQSSIAVIPKPLEPLAVAVPIMLTTRPVRENGMTPQFIQPRNGMNAINIPNTLKILIIKPSSCIEPLTGAVFLTKSGVILP